MEDQVRLSSSFRFALRGDEVSPAVRQEGERIAADLESKPPHLRDLWSRLWTAGERLLESRRGDEQSQLLLTGDVRSQRGWDEISLAWENQDLGLQQTTQALSRLYRFLDTTEIPGASDQATIISEAASIQDNLDQLRTRLGTILTPQTEDNVLWVARNQRNQGKGEINFNSAPLDVAATLQEQLFNRKESVVLTSATLSTDGTFDHFRRRTGVPEDSGELQVGTPFDYRRAALLLIPEDMPQPNAEGLPASGVQGIG